MSHAQKEVLLPKLDEKTSPAPPNAKIQAKNKLCPKCKKSCKQFDYVNVVVCPDYEKKN